jgi:hypothetical protein
MMNRWLVVALLSAGASIADAKNIALDKDGLTAWVPDQWTVQTSDVMVSAMAPNNAASCVFMSQPIRDLDLAYKSMPKAVGTLVPGMTWGQPQRVTIANAQAIVLKGIADVDGHKLEANVATLITPNQRALYVITLVEAESAPAYDQTLRGILYGLKAGSGAPVPPPSRDNPCWEMKTQPNGWSRRDWNGVSFLLPQGWSSAEARDPNTNQPYLTITGGGASIMLFTYGAARHDAAWQTIAGTAQQYAVGQAAWGTVDGQRALCAKGQASDVVVLHKGNVALGVLAKASDPTAMRGVLGSIRWR